MWIVLIILYFIWIPICFISGWASVCAYLHEVKWKSITIGEFLLIAACSIIPLSNIIASFVSFDDLYKRGIYFRFLDEPLFHERD